MSLHFLAFIFSIIIWLNSFSNINGAVRFTNIECILLDKSFGNFRTCELKIVGRNVVALNFYGEIFQLPLSNLSVNFDLQKRANGYRPFLYNYSMDVCDFMKNRKRLPLFYILFNVVKEHSNLNHTCPFNHDLIVKNLVLKDEHFRYLPLPTGDYLFKTSMAVYNKWRVIINAYIAIVEN